MIFPFSFWNFKPASLPGMAHWFSADYGVTLDGSGRAASVLDQSGNNRTLSGQGGGGAGTGQNPTIVAAAQAGRPGFGFTTLQQSCTSILVRSTPATRFSRRPC